MKSKAIFILPPSNYDFNKSKTPSWDICRIPPIGLIAIASYLHVKGHNVKIIDCREIIVKYKTNDYYKFVLDIIEKFGPNIIGINMLTALFDEAKKISEEIKKKFPNITIVAGGPHPSIEPQLTFQQIPYIDAICIGPGEEVSLDIMDGKDISNIPGLMQRDHIDKFEKRTLNLNIDKYPFPNYDLVNHRYYTEFTLNTTTGWGHKSLTALTSRSCPYSCKFCASDWSKPFRYHSSEYVIEMVKYLSKYDINVISFFDDTIAAVKDRLYKICEGFINSKLFWPHTNLRWYGSIRANQIDLETLKLMKRAGCFGLGIGIESGSDRMLQVINKKTTVEMNKKACALVKEAGLSLGNSFMIGIPGETEVEIRKTLDFIKNVSLNTVGIGIFRPLPGSPFYYEFINNGTLLKENINWSDLGNFSITSKYLFCNVQKDRFEKIWNEALEIISSKHWSVVHEESLLKYPKEIKGIALKRKIKIAKSGKYGELMQVSYRPFSFFSLYNICKSALRNFIPLGLRAEIRVQIIKLKKLYQTF